MSATIVVSDYKTMAAFGRVLRTSCIIRKRGPDDPIAYSENQDGSQGIPYQPVQFPKGTWIVDKPEATDDPLMAPYFMRTNAHQIIIGTTGSAIMDWGYGIHFDSEFEDTWGCLHLYSAEDAEWLAGQIIDIQSTLEDVVQLVVA